MAADLPPPDFQEHREFSGEVVDTAICVSTVGCNGADLRDPDGLPLLALYVEGEMLGSVRSGTKPAMLAGSMMILRAKDAGSIIGAIMAAAGDVGLEGTVTDWAQFHFDYITEHQPNRKPE